MVDITPEQLKEANQEFHDLATMLGVDMHPPTSPYTKADVAQVREAREHMIKTEAQAFLDKGLADGSIPSKVQTRRGLRDNPIKAESVLDDMLKKRYSGDPEILARVSAAIDGADSNMLVISEIADVHEHRLQDNFHNLANVLGFNLPPPNPDPDKISYSEEEVGQVNDVYNSLLAQAQVILDTSDNKDPNETVETVLTRSLLSSIESPTEEMGNYIYGLVTQAPAYVNHLTIKAGGQPVAPVNAQTNTNDGQPQQYREVTKTVGVGANGNEVDFDQRIQRLENALAEIVPTLNTLDDYLGVNLRPVQDIKAPDAADGFADARMLESYNGSIQHLNFLLDFKENGKMNLFKANASDQFLTDMKNSASEDFDPNRVDDMMSMLIDGVNESIVKKGEDFGKETDPAKKAELDAEIQKLGVLKEEIIPQIMKEIVALESAGLLSNPVTVTGKTVRIPIEVVAQTTNNPTKTPTPKDSAPQGNSDNSKPPATSTKSTEELLSAANDEGVAGDVALIEKILFDLGGNIKDFDKFGLSESIVTPLTLADLEDDGFGENSQDILAKAITLIRTIDGDKNPNGLYSAGDSEALKRAILTKDALQPIRDVLEISQMSEDEAKKYFEISPSATDEQKLAHEEHQKRVDTNLNLGVLNGMFEALDNIEGAKLINEEKARSTTKMNIMLDGMFTAMDKFMPGMSGMLQNFFNSDQEIFGISGKMIGAMLSMFGINVNRLWGDKNDMGVEAARPIVEKGYDLFVDHAKSTLGDGAGFQEVMSLAKQDMLDKLKNSDGSIVGGIKKSAIDKIMNQIFDGKGEEFIEEALTNAMDAAIAAGDYDAARTAFSDSLIQAGADYQNNSDLTLDKMSEALTSTTALAKSPEMQKIVQAEIDAGNVTPNKPAAVENDSHVVLAFTPDTNDYEQEPMRFSEDAIRAMQEVIGNEANRELLGLEIAPNDMKIDGKYSGMATRNTSAIFEELAILAQIHALTESGVEIPEGDFEGLEHKLSNDNLGDVEAYMKAKGLSDADVNKFIQNASELANDYRSTTLPDNPIQEISVLEQSFLENQIAASLVLAPRASAEIVPALGSDAETEVAPVTNSGAETEAVPVTADNIDGATSRVKVGVDVTTVGAANVEVNVSVKVTQISSSFNGASGCSTNNPETFKDLCRLTEGEAKYLLDAGLDVEKLFEKHISIKDHGVSEFVILEPSAHGLKGAELPDLVIAMRDGDNIDYRVVNYGKDGFKPLSEQRAAGMSDMSQIHNPFGKLRIDDFLDHISVSSGGMVREAANVTTGFAGIKFIASDVNGGTFSQNGMRYVYQDAYDEKGAIEKYSSGYQNRFNARSAYEQVQRDMKYTGGVPSEKHKGVIVNAGQRPLNEPEVKEEKQSWIARLFNGSGDDASDVSAEIKQNAGDMNVDAANEDEYNPHNADLLNLARPLSQATAR